MSHNILITDASGYLGGSVLSRCKDASLPAYNKLFALVRNQEQAESVRRIYAAEPLTFSPDSEQDVEDAVINFIKALSKVQATTGPRVHFYVGTKQFSDIAGADARSPLLDTDPGLYEKHKAQRTNIQEFQQSIATNVTIIDARETRGVRTYIFSPYMVYGKGEGFGNELTIQMVDIISAARATGQVYKFSKQPTYRPMLDGDDLDHGRRGFYLASSGSMAWDDVYQSIAQSLAQRGIIPGSEVCMLNDRALVNLADVLYVDQVLVRSKISGNCSYTPKHRFEVDWTPRYAPEHILEAADEEVDFVLQNLSNNYRGLR